MRRWIVNILAGVSLTIFIAVMLLWPRSYWRADKLFVDRTVGLSGARNNEKRVEIASKKGGVAFLWLLEDSPRLSFQPPFRDLPENWSWGLRTGRADSVGGFAFKCRIECCGFAFGHEPYHAMNAWETGSYTAVILPHWFLALLFAILPAWRFGGWKRRRRRYRLSHGLCVKCGYDLHATPDPDGPLLDRCPECGTRAPEQTAPR